jgi:pimeloyl-ACP methyl ester carboxylesterase
VRVLYLHGFASGPRSTKGMAFERHFAERDQNEASARSGFTGPRSTAEGRCGVTIERLDLRVPSLEHLRLSAMLEVVRGALDTGGPAVVIGSSLGGLTAARVAERDDRVRALVLLAPAFHMAKRWREQLGAAWDEWKASGWRTITDFTTGQPARVDFAFWQDLDTTDRDLPDVRVPTLVLHGVRDDVVPVEHSRDFARGRAHVELVELDDTHELVASIPTLLARSEAFLARLPR